MSHEPVIVCRADELPPGGVREVSVAGRSIGVFNIDGELYAVRNMCPHQGAPLCRGKIGGTMLASNPQEWIYGLDRRILRCPWHGWEFDVATGRSLFDPARIRVKTYAVEVRDGDVVLIPGAAPAPAAAPDAATTS